MAQFAGAAPFLIAGPCVVESGDLNLRVGEALAALGNRLGVPVIYKASFDKANPSRRLAAPGPCATWEPRLADPLRVCCKGAGYNHLHASSLEDCGRSIPPHT